MVGKGTVTPLSESISVEDAANVAKKVAEAIAVQRQQLQTLETFSDENQSLCKLLLDLPDLVSYNIMVPFGKAAFMPGRLIHTNEFLVLLGDGLYAERSAKQAAEILMRRSEFMDSKINAIKGQIKDLQAEASFATNTAAEAAAGLVEIREEYAEPSVKPVVEVMQSNIPKRISEAGEKIESDDEDAALMLRIAELEKAEEAAEAEDEDDQIDEDVETDLLSAFRRSLLDDLDEESEESDADSEEAESDARTVANTLFNRDTGHHVRFEADDRMGDFQSTLVGRNSVGESSSREQRGPNMGHCAPRRDQSASSVPDIERIASTPTQNHLPLQSQKPSGAQQRNNLGVYVRKSLLQILELSFTVGAFSGTVMERNVETFPPISLVPGSRTISSRPVSKFKQRKG